MRNATRKFSVAAVVLFVAGMLLVPAGRAQGNPAPLSIVDPNDPLAAQKAIHDYQAYSQKVADYRAQVQEQLSQTAVQAADVRSRLAVLQKEEQALSGTRRQAIQRQITEYKQWLQKADDARVLAQKNLDDCQQWERAYKQRADVNVHNAVEDTRTQMEAQASTATPGGSPYLATGASRPYGGWSPASYQNVPVGWLSPSAALAPPPYYGGYGGYGGYGYGGYGSYSGDSNYRAYGGYGHAHFHDYGSNAFHSQSFSPASSHIHIR